MNVREWPPGHRLFSEGGLHLAFDPPQEGDEQPAILMKIDAGRNEITVMRVAVFRDDVAALAWFAKQRKRYAH